MLAAPGIPIGEQMLLFVSLALFLLTRLCHVHDLYRPHILPGFYSLLWPPEAFTPTYWVSMGAIAITTLAGSLLVQEVWLSIFLEETLPFLRGSPLLIFWVLATWWIPPTNDLEALAPCRKRVPVHL